MEQRKVTAVVGNHDLPIQRRPQQHLDITQAKPPQLFRRLNRKPLLAQKRGDGLGNILVKRKEHAASSIRDRGVGLQHRIDRGAMPVVVE